MFSRMIIWFMTAVLELCAFFVILIGVFSGGVVALALGLGDLGEMGNAALGFVAGSAVASVLFGIPIVIINLNNNLSRAVDLLSKIEKSTRPAGFASSGGS